MQPKSPEIFQLFNSGADTLIFLLVSLHPTLSVCSRCVQLRMWIAETWKVDTPLPFTLLLATTGCQWWSTYCTTGQTCMPRTKGVTFKLLHNFTANMKVDTLVHVQCFCHLTAAWFPSIMPVRTVTMKWQSCWSDMAPRSTWPTCGSSHRSMKLLPRANTRSVNCCSRWDLLFPYFPPKLPSAPPTHTHSWSSKQFLWLLFHASQTTAE